MNKKCLVNDKRAKGNYIACFLSFHRRLENNKIHRLHSEAFNNLTVLSELYVYLTLEASKKNKKATRTLRGEGLIHLIGMIFGTYNKLPWYFQLSETTWCLIGFHGNQSYKNDVINGRHLGFSNFQILFYFEL